MKFIPLTIRESKIWRSLRSRKHGLAALTDQVIMNFNFWVSLRSNHTPVLIYQMGKVGSSSLYFSLRNYCPVVIHCHRWEEDYPDWRVRQLYKMICLEKKQVPLKIISLTREPISRNISGFFQTFEHRTGVPYAQHNFAFEEIIEIFLSRYDHDKCFSWFNEKILNVFGINVYGTPFPESGIATYKKGKIELLVMRSEISDEQKIKTVEKFLGITNFQLKNKNIGAKKEYAETYKLFKEQVQLPLDYINKMCDSQYFNHFYSQEEVESVRKKWLDRIT